MNSFFVAVKKGEDHWRIYLPKEESMAHCKNDALINPTFADQLRMQTCEKHKKSRRIWQLMPGC